LEEGTEGGVSVMAVPMEAEAAPLPSVERKSGRVDSVMVEKAVDALLKWSGAQKQREKAQLLEDDQFLYVVVGMNKVPDRGRTNPYRVALPHPLYQLDGSHEVCLIVSDRENAKLKLNKQTAKERIGKEGLNIAKVIPLSKLKKEYFGFEAKRKLCGSYDIFLADDRILGELPKLLGKTFYKKKKHPIPVNLTRAQWTGQVTAALNSTFLYVSGGTCSVVKVARVSQAREEIVENVKAVVEGVAQQIPKKWTNIRALFLKTLESVALPLYQSLPEMPLKIELPGLSQVKSTEPVKKKAKLGKGSKEKVGRLLKNEDKDKMDVVEDTVDAEKPKKRKRKDAEGKRKTLRAAN
jgi:ribosome biogenesis protein UTP30